MALQHHVHVLGAAMDRLEGGGGCCCADYISQTHDTLRITPIAHDVDLTLKLPMGLSARFNISNAV